MIPFKKHKLPPELEKRKNHFEGALNFLKKTTVSKENHPVKLCELPWYLVLGTPNANKNKLLTQSHLKFLLTKRNAKAYQEEQRHCDWWATKDAVFLEANSLYFQPGDKSHEDAWQQLLVLLKKRPLPPLQGILFVMDLADIAVHSKTKQSPLLSLLKQRLEDLESLLEHPTPVYFVFNHTDCLSGFFEYFEELSKEELTRPWGITLQQAQTTSLQKMADTFDIEYDHLLADLNNALLSKLHQQRNLEKRAKIKDFPLQMESLKKPLASFLQQLAPFLGQQRQCKFRGLYFMSLGLYKETFDRLLKPLGQSFELATLTTPHVPAAPKTYFVLGFFKDILFSDAPLLMALHQEKKWNRQRITQWIAVGLSGCFILGALVTGSAHFNEQMQHLSEAERALAQYAILEKTDSLSSFKQQLTALDLLNVTEEALGKDKFYEFLLFDLKRRKNLNAMAHQAYQEVLSELATTTLISILNQTPTTSEDIGALLDTLKYIASVQSSHGNTTAPMPLRLGELLEKSHDLTGEEKEKFQQHLSRLSLAPSSLKTIPPQLIQQGQNILQQTAPETLLLALLNNELLNAPPSVIEGTPEKGFSEFKESGTLSVPALYTKAQFQRVYDTLIPQAVNALQQDSLALGIPQHAAMTMAPDVLIDKTRAYYVEEYEKFWARFLKNLSLNEPRNLEEANELLSSFVTPQSSLQKILFAVEENTQVTYANLPTPVSLAFNDFHQGLLALTQDNGSPLRGQLKILNDTVSLLLKAPSLEQASFDVAKEWAQSFNTRFGTLYMSLESMPQPLQTWVGQTLDSTFSLTLKEAGKQVATTWNNTLVSQYETAIAPYYPFNKEAPEELSVTAFNEFYSPKGKLLNFFHEYIEPFTMVQNNVRLWRPLGNTQMPLPSGFLQVYERAEHIGKIFFNPITAQYGLQLALTPLHDNALKEIDIAINDTGAQYLPGKSIATTLFYWPSTNEKNEISLTFIGKKGEETLVKATGPWALYRLLDKTQLTLPPRKDALEFTYGPQSPLAQFLMVSQQNENPLRPDVLEEMKLQSL